MLKAALWTAALATLSGLPAPDARAAGADPCAAGHAYMDLVRKRDYVGIGNLFAEDSEYLSYGGPEPFRGPKAIAEVYRKIFGNADDGRQFGKQTDVRARSYVGQGSYCVIELESNGDKTHPDDYILISVDHITTDAAGKITRFAVFVRPGLKLPAVGQPQGK